MSFIDYDSNFIFLSSYLRCMNSKIAISSTNKNGNYNIWTLSVKAVTEKGKRLLITINEALASPSA